MASVGLLGGGILLACFVRLVYVKLYYPYEGRHWTKNHQKIVPPEYYPPHQTVQYGELWLARMERRIAYLYIDIDRLPKLKQVQTIRRLSDWKWSNTPTDEWPEAWRIAA